MKKKGLDERQEKLVDKMGALSFYVMFFVCVVVIVVQLIRGSSLRMVFGETIVLLAGGITCLAGNMKNGIWSGKGRKATILENLVLSVVMSGIFSVLYAAVIIRTGAEAAGVAKATIGFFAGIAVLGFVVLTILSHITWRRKKKEEQKYAD